MGLPKRNCPSPALYRTPSHLHLHLESRPCSKSQGFVGQQPHYEELYKSHVFYNMFYPSFEIQPKGSLEVSHRFIRTGNVQKISCAMLSFRKKNCLGICECPTTPCVIESHGQSNGNISVEI